MASFKIQHYDNHAYRTVGWERSIGGSGLRVHTLADQFDHGRFRVLSPRGKVVLKGRVVKHGEIEFD